MGDLKDLRSIVRQLEKVQQRCLDRGGLTKTQRLLLSNLLFYVREARYHLSEAVSCAKELDK